MGAAKRPTGSGGPPVRAPSLPEIRAAAKRLSDVAVRTPLVPLHSFETTLDIWLKPEILQPVGSYKLRGVYNWAASLSEGERERGFSTHSAGNTAQALGYVARLFNVPARSLMPEDAPKVKIEGVKSYGVTPVPLPFGELLDFVFESRWELEPYSSLNPWGDEKMLAGNATIGLEIVEDLPDVDSVYVPVGGGGLVGGVGSALRALKPGTRVIGVQSESCPSLYASLEAGGPTWVESMPTICDGTIVPLVVDEMYPLLRQVVDDVVLVSEDEVKAAIKRLLLGNKLLVEGSGAMSVAAAVATPAEQRGRTVCILSGGSIDTDKLMDIVA